MARSPAIKRLPIPCSRCGGSGRAWTTDPATLRARREWAGLSLREFARRIGFTPAYISDVELGRRNATDAIVAQYEDLREATE